MAPTREQVLQALTVVQDPDLKRDIVSLGFVKDVAIAGDRVGVTIELTTPACPVKDLLREEAQRAVQALPGVGRADVTMTAQVRRSVAAPGPGDGSLIPTIKNVIPIASGKGGVGKSTVSANLALASRGAAVGLMDADVYGPSIPTLLGLTVEPEMDDRNRIHPVDAHGIQVMSMGFFMQPGEAVVWRGPMLHKTVQQFLGGVLWGELDYLLVDLPPGTGDVQLSLCQSIPITGAVIVSTPQDVALNVAQKAVAMFGKLRAPVLGLLENMSHYACPHCGQRDEIFGTGGGRRLAERLQLPFLGEIPLATPVRTASDAGTPIVLADPQSPAAKAFVAAAEQLAAQVSIRGMQGAGQPKVSF